jgi:riboflavin transporter FmnP
MIPPCDEPIRINFQEEKKMRENQLLSTRNVAVMGMFGALAAVLMLFEIPLPFLAPSFYGLDVSEVPILVGTFALGPVAGAVMEVVKILIKLVLKPTSTGFVGEFANLVFGCSMVIPAGMIYQIHKTKKGAMAAMAAGTVIMAAVGVAGNALVMIPFYSNFMPLENILAAGAAINPAVGNVWTFALFCVGPFNVVKGIVVSLITALVYKRVSGVIHSVRVEKKRERLARQ